MLIFIVNLMKANNSEHSFIRYCNIKMFVRLFIGQFCSKIVIFFNL